MAMPIVMVSGDKGGTGKSMVSLALVDFLTEIRKEKVYLIETDSTNPDVGRVFFQIVDGVQRLPGECIDLDREIGWSRLIDIADEFHDHFLVINSGARSGAGIEAYFGLLAESLPYLKRELTTLWIINQQRDSLELGRKYLEKTSKYGRFHIVCNKFFSSDVGDSFSLYQNSHFRENVEGQGGKSLYFPRLNSVAADFIRSRNLSPQQIIRVEVMSKLSVRVRMELWRRDFTYMFNEIFDENTSP